MAARCRRLYNLYEWYGHRRVSRNRLSTCASYCESERNVDASVIGMPGVPGLIWLAHGSGSAVQASVMLRLAGESLLTVSWWLAFSWISFFISQLRDSNAGAVHKGEREGERGGRAREGSGLVQGTVARAAAPWRRRATSGIASHSSLTVDDALQLDGAVVGLQGLVQLPNAKVRLRLGNLSPSG